MNYHQHQLAAYFRRAPRRAIALTWVPSDSPLSIAAWRFNERWNAAACSLMESFSFLSRRFRAVSTVFS